MTSTPKKPDYTLLGPNRGPCAFCGFEDARHREGDGILENYLAGDTVDDIAGWYEFFVEDKDTLIRFLDSAGVWKG